MCKERNGDRASVPSGSGVRRRRSLTTKVDYFISFTIPQFFGSGPIDAVRKTSKKPVRVYFWFGGSATSLFCVAGPERKGGKGDLRARSQEMAKLTGVSVEEAAGQVSNTARLVPCAMDGGVNCALDLLDGQGNPCSNAGFTADV